jgi:hypothetical protein
MHTFSTRRITFADESSTGQYFAEYRGIGRATIAARCEADDDFEWLARFKHDFLPDGVEPKSEIVLAVMGNCPRARETVLGNIQGSTIIIVDFYEHTRGLIEGVFKAAGLALPPAGDPLDALRSHELLRPVAGSILRSAREGAIVGSIIPSVESTLRTAGGICRAPLGSGRTLFNRGALREMNPREFKELVARFSVALGDALHPDVQAEALEELYQQFNVFSPGRIAVISIQHAMEPDRVYDQGQDSVFELVSKAHSDIEKMLQAARDGHIIETSAAGRLSQEDSRCVLGLQAADIAAAIARREFERSPRSVRQGAVAVRGLFARVLLNDTWM